MQTKKPLVLVILDGWGEWDNVIGNAVAQAKLPTIDKLNLYYPKIRLQASGVAAGLPWKEVGNSEVGHQTLGSGQVICQLLPTIDASILDGDFFKKELIIQAIEKSKRDNSSIHLMGLLSDGGVHSHIDHLLALISSFGEKGIKNVFVHAITDGRDTSPKSAKTYLKKLDDALKENNVGQIATLAGRYFTMDRNDNWDRIEKAYAAMVEGKGIKETDPFNAVDNQYKKDVTDEYLLPVNITDVSGNPIGLIKENDTVICFNFRKDRSRQITRAFVDENFSEFKEVQPIKNVNYICFTEYEEGLSSNILFPQAKITTCFGEIISQKNLNQLRIAETEKYAHVTYFFNGGKEDPFPGEDRILVPSKKNASYAEIPEMSAQEVTDKLLEAIEKEIYDFILVNYANSDMVGHTGVLKAGIKAVEFVDQCLDKLIKEVLQRDGQLIVTADHGNIEEMINLQTGEIDTKHSINPVPCWLVTANNHRATPLKEAPDPEICGLLSDIAPTLLHILEIEKPEQMSGESLLDLLQHKN